MLLWWSTARLLGQTASAFRFQTFSDRGLGRPGFSPLTSRDESRIDQDLHPLHRINPVPGLTAIGLGDSLQAPNL